MFTIELGSKVKSTITGFAGTAVSRSEHLNGCNRYWVQPTIDKDGKMIDGYWFDENELEVTAAPKLARKSQDRGGFPSRVR